MRTDDYAEQRGLEQLLHDTHKPRLTRSTDRKNRHRRAALQLATAALIVGRLIDYRNRWNPA